LDFEGELAVVIGRGGRRICETDALRHIAGFTVFNDGSVRDFQYKTTQFLPGKCFWRSGSAGPFLVTPDEAGPVEGMRLETRLNGEVVQSAMVEDLVFSIGRIISEISVIMPLHTGDIIATGTPGGVGVYRAPPLFMKPGDFVEVEISGVGLLQNPVISETE
jgi:2-keto-4-pentenoate hydratase/2-oxohepta-3-ene-1,7-dioic acid hydratase in catechol pathway